MARPRSITPPAYSHHKASGQALVYIDRKAVYLGPYRSRESRVEYDRVIASWLANGRSLPPAPTASNEPSAGITVAELLALYLDHAKVYYADSRELLNMRDAMDPLARKFARLPVAEFGPLALEELRQAWIDGTYRPPNPKCRPPKPLSRKVVNARVNRVKRVFRWAVARQHIRPEVLQSLEAIEPLKHGRCKARETKPVRPVSEAIVAATIPHLPKPVGDMVQIQLHTGMRSGELVLMRTGDIDRTGKVWIFTPEHHKTEHHGHARTIWIGPRAQEYLQPYLRLNLTEYIFSPRAAAEARWAERRANRKTPMTPSQRVRKRKRRPLKAPGCRYTPTSYGKAIREACLKHGIEPWHPHQLRHLAGTRLRKEHGIELARIILGHASIKATEIYAEVDKAQAAEIVAKIG